MEKQMITEILGNFTKITGIKAKWRPLREADFMYDYVDGIVQFDVDGNKIEIPADVKNNIQYPHLPALMVRKQHNKKVLLLAKSIMPRFKKELHALDINYIDAAGNAFIEQKPLFIWIEGRKDITNESELNGKPFSKAGLKVVFQFLLDDDYIDAPFRKIAKAAEVSLDTVHKTINGLKELQFLVPLNNYKLTWNKKKELLSRWITEYDARLKPRLHIGNFSFLAETDFLKWKKLNFQSPLTKWGGEPAGELLTDNLKPERLTIYTSEHRLDIIKRYRLYPDSKGNVSVYQRFWEHDEIKKNTVPPLLVYTDLINTGNKRNIEIAQKIYEQYLQNKF
jgi:hypothetical protein